MSKVKANVNKRAVRAQYDPLYLTRALQPWERLPKEGDLAFAAFNCYLKLGPGKRTVPAVLGQLKAAGIDVGTGKQLYRFRKDYAWDERVAAWDRGLQRVDAEVAETAQAKAAKKLAGVLDDTAALLERDLKAYRKKAEMLDAEGKEHVAVLSPGQWTNLLDRLVTLRRLQENKATEIKEHTGQRVIVHELVNVTPEKSLDAPGQAVVDAEYKVVEDAGKQNS
jgi:hypothetical protein